MGGGFGPPLLGFLVAFAARRVDAPLAWWRSRPPRVLRPMAAAWPAVFVATISVWLLMMPGLMLLDLLPGMADLRGAVPVSVAVALAGLVLSIVAGFARDSRAAGFPAAAPGTASSSGRAWSRSAAR